MRRLSFRGFIGIAAFWPVATVLYAQAPPPIHGVTGTVATKETTKAQQKAANKIVVVTEDGVEHVFDAAKGVLVHGGKALTDLKPGTTVVVHYTTDSGGAVAQEVDRVATDGLSVTEGMVTKIDRSKKEISIRYDNGKTETLTLTDRAAEDAGQDFKNAPAGTTRIVVYYSDEAGRKVAHFFKQKP